MTHTVTYKIGRRALALSAAAALALAGCGSTGASTTESASTALTVEEPWAKASEGPMTAAFGIIKNESDADITIVSATTSASGHTELHEVVDQGGKMIMRPKEGGFVVPANGEHVLQPGGDHVMIMKMTEPVTAGDQVTVTMTDKDGKDYEFTALAKPYSGAEEEYKPDGGGETGMNHGGSGADHGGMEDSGDTGHDS